MVVAFSACVRREVAPAVEPMPDLELGGNFVLSGPGGQPFDSRSLRGKTVLLFFGYTTCPDICPTTLGRLARAFALLGEKRLDDKVQAVFISVDPERDTPAKLQEYLSYFAVPTIGLTGTPEELAALAQKYGASFEKVPVEGKAGYLIDHSTYVYLIDAVGRVRHLFKHADPPEKIATIVERLIVEGCCTPGLRADDCVPGTVPP